MTTAHTAGGKRGTGPLGVAIAGFIGTTIEWYDFFLYGTAAATVLGPLFFPSQDPLAATLSAFATYAVGFFARPVGGVLFGHFGDRIGRKNSLVATLLIMGVATFLVGCLPTYQTIGVWAPILLVTLRFAQGFAVGGEWGGAVLMAVEHAPARKRAFYGSFPQLGSPGGLLLSTGVFSLVNVLAGDDFLAGWWRVPFLFSGVLVIVGLVIRLRIEESPAFKQVKESKTEVSAPFLQVMRTAWRRVILGVGVTLLAHGGFYFTTTFMLAYITKSLSMPRQVGLTGQIVVAVVEGVTLLFFGLWAIRTGRRPIAAVSGFLVALWAFPLYWLANMEIPAVLWFAQGLAILLGTGHYAVLSSLLTDQFPTRLRYTAVSLCYQISSVIGGLMPLLATYLLTITDSYWPAAVLLLLVGVITGTSCVLAREYPPLDEGRPAARGGATA